MSLEIERIDHTPSGTHQYWVRVNESRCLIIEFKDDTQVEDVLAEAQKQLDFEATFTEQS